MRCLSPRLGFSAWRAGYGTVRCQTSAILRGRAPPTVLPSRYSSGIGIDIFRAQSPAGTLTLGGKKYQVDAWHNVPQSIASAVGRQLHLQKDHPLSITRQIIECQFPSPVYNHYNTLFPVVTTHQNFDSLGFPADHPGRSRSDTYYINRTTVLRTHTSAHQAETFKANTSSGFTICADVYRRDAIDRSHNPIFHQMEGARLWDRSACVDRSIAQTIERDAALLPEHGMDVKDTPYTIHAERNPLQGDHDLREVEAISRHLKRSVELMVKEIFRYARLAAPKEESTNTLKARWVETTFPFTSPSWELEVYWQGEWLELLGCGIVKQQICKDAGMPAKIGWAFGIGLERIAMLLFGIPDIRLFWSQDERFLGQFAGLSHDLTKLKRFSPFSKYPGTYKDVSFWAPLQSDDSCHSGQSRTVRLHENDVMEVVREVCGKVVEDVRLVDTYTHPTTARKSFSYRIVYRSLEKTLTSAEANECHSRVSRALVEKLGVEIR